MNLSELCPSARGFCFSVSFLYLQFEQEYRRFHLKRGEISTFDGFHKHVRALHKLLDIDGVTISYTDPLRGDLLPINNDDNFAHALSLSKPLLRVFVYRGQGKSR